MKKPRPRKNGHKKRRTLKPKPRKNAHKKRRPLKRRDEAKRTTKPPSGTLFGDPIFMGHLAALILRSIELTKPGNPLDLIAAPYPKNRPSDVCVNCGMTCAASYENAMGMMCSKDPAGEFIHTFRPPETLPPTE
jgi:hypothetical protein